MKGYLLFITDSSDSFAVQDLEIPGHEDGRLVPQVHTDKVSLFSWGSSLGDVNFSIRKNESLLILNGYITAAPKLANFSNQQKVCDLLREHLDANNPLQEFISITPQLHGSFSLVYVKLKENTAYAVTDRIASRAVWVKKNNGTLIVSSLATSIAKVTKASEYDLAGLGSYLLYSCPIEPTRSLYDGIRAQREGRIRVLQPSTDEREHTWYQFRHEPNHSLSYKQWVNLAAQRLQEAASRILTISKNPMVFLSGGVDSRLTAAALCAVGGKPLCVTLGDSVNLEVKVARRVAAALGCPHEIIIRDPHWYLRGLSSAVFESNGCYLWTHSHFHEAYRKCQEKFRIDSALVGDFGEAFSKLLCSVDDARTSVWSEDEFITSFDQLLLPAYRPVDRAKTLRLLHSDVSDFVQKELRMDIQQRYSDVSRVSSDPKIVADYFFRWQSASCCPTFQIFEDLRSAGPERNLMFDQGIHDLLEVLPSTLRNKANLGASLISKLHGRAGNVINANTRLPLSFPSSFHVLVGDLRYRIAKLRKAYIANTHRTYGSWSYLPRLYTDDPLWRRSIEDILYNHENFPSDIFNPTAIETCWKNFCHGDLSLSKDIESLVGLGTLKQYI